MVYSEGVKRKIPGEASELGRRKALWGKIDSAYEHDGEDAIKPLLVECSNSISREFDKLLKQLRAKL